MRPAASQAASPEPIAIEIEKTARQVVTTSSLPPSTFFTSGGISESATAPTSQNQLVTSAPHHSRGSSRRNFNNPPVDLRIFFSTSRSGAASPVRGMNRLAPQHISENTIISNAKWAGSPPSLAANAADDGAEQDRDEGRAFDQRVAGRQFRAGEMVGQDAVFDRAEQRGDHAEQEQRDEQHRHGMQAESEHRDERNPDFRKFQPLCHDRLVESVGKLTAQRGEKEVGRNENRGRERDQRLGVGAADLEQDQEDQRILRKLSLNAEKNWHQNRGAKRRVSSKDEDMASPVVRSG